MNLNLEKQSPESALPGEKQELPKEVYKNLPLLDFVAKQTTFIGGEVLLVGLAPEQSRAVKLLAIANGLEIEETELTANEVSALLKKGLEVKSKTALRLGDTVGCQEKLFELFKEKK